MSISIIIVNWNSGSQLSECLASILAYRSGLAVDVIVIDNGSSDNSELAALGLDCVQLIRSSENIGFARACNVGARLACGDYLLFLNPDTILGQASLSGAIQFMQAPGNEKVGICGIQLRDEFHNISRSCSRFPTAPGLVLHAVGLDRLFPTLGHQMIEWSHDMSRKVEHVIGAFFFVRKPLFISLDGFDERFFVYLEDLDFSLRARQNGWESYYLADVDAMHVGGGCSKTVKAQRLFYSIRSRLLYAEKHFDLVALGCIAAVTLIAEPLVRIGYSLARGDIDAALNSCKAYWRLSQWLFWPRRRSS